MDSISHCMRGEANKKIIYLAAYTFIFLKKYNINFTSLILTLLYHINLVILMICYSMHNNRDFITFFHEIGFLATSEYLDSYDYCNQECTYFYLCYFYKIYNYLISKASFFLTCLSHLCPSLLYHLFNNHQHSTLHDLSECLLALHIVLLELSPRGLIERLLFFLSLYLLWNNCWIIEYDCHA